MFGTCANFDTALKIDTKEFKTAIVERSDLFGVSFAAKCDTVSGLLLLDNIWNLDC